MRKKFTMLFALLLACVGVVKAQITDLAELSNDAAYVLQGERGYIAANDGYVMGSNNGPLAGTTLDETNALHQFAILATEGKYYLYNIGAKKFVMKNANQASLSEYPVHTIEIVSATDTGTDYDWIIKLNGYYINLSNSSGNGVYTNYNTEDGGNRWSIKSVATFDSGEALGVIALGLAEERQAVCEAIAHATAVYEACEDKTVSQAVALKETIDGASQKHGNADATVETLQASIEELETAIENLDALTYNLLHEFDLTTQKFRLKNYTTNLYLTVVTTESTDRNNGGVQIKSAGAGQTFNFVATGEEKEYKIKSVDGSYLTAFSGWGYKATETESDDANHTMEYVGDGKYLLRSVLGYVGSNDGATTDGAVMYSNHDAGKRNIYWVLEPVMKTEEELLQDELAAQKAEAEDKVAELQSIAPSNVVVAAIDALNEAISNAEANAGSTDVEVLNNAIESLTTAINSIPTQNLTFQNGALASLEDGEYVIYYEDANRIKHYLVNNKTTKRVITSTVAAVYDVTLGNVSGGYAAYAYYFDMNESKISNPTNTADKEIQVENKGGYNYGSNRLWDSQVLYMNAEGKYAIRTTNCKVGEGWNSDCFIKVSEDGLTVSGQNTDLSDALYMWNVVKASEANVAYAMNIDEYKYMTLYLNYAAEVPAGVAAYAVSGVENGELALVSVGDVIPENTPVIIEGEKGSYSFTYATPVEAYAEANLLKGTWLDSDVTPTQGYDAYVMALDKENDRIVMGKALLNANGGTTQFKNRANKAYLELQQEVAAGAPMFSFGRGEGTTVIDNVQLTNDNVVIYDLTGRRVQTMEKGFYIVNGKKVIR